MLPPEISEQIVQVLPWQTRLDLGFPVKEFPFLQELAAGQEPEEYNVPSPLVKAFFTQHPEYMDTSHADRRLQDYFADGEGQFITELLPVQIEEDDDPDDPGDRILPMKLISYVQMFYLPNPLPNLPPPDSPFTTKDVEAFAFGNAWHLQRDPNIPPFARVYQGKKSSIKLGDWSLRTKQSKFQKGNGTVIISYSSKEGDAVMLETYYKEFLHGPFYSYHIDNKKLIYRGRYYRNVVIEDFEGEENAKRVVDPKYWDLASRIEDNDQLIHEVGKRSPWVIGNYVVKEDTNSTYLRKK